MTHYEDGGHRVTQSLERLTPIEEVRRRRKRLRLVIFLVLIALLIGWLIFRG